jgi:uncharacterized membrane protein YidH (DUF202 family)
VKRLLRLEPYARLGFAARGIVYLALGYFALMSQHGTQAATVLEGFQKVPLGNVLLVLLAFGLFGYGLWRLIGGILDLDDEGRSAYGIATRLGLVISGLGHWLLCAGAILILVSGSAGADQQEETAASTAAAYPGGAWLVGAVGLVIIMTGVGQWLIGARGAFMRFLSTRQPRFARFAGTLGYGARGAVFVVIGWQVLTVAIGWGERPLGFDSALDVIARRQWVFPAVAVGLILFGIFSLMAAMWLRIRDEDVDRRAKLAGRWLQR